MVWEKNENFALFLEVNCAGQEDNCAGLHNLFLSM